MSTLLHQPDLPADELLRTLRVRHPHAAVERAVMPSGVVVIGVSVARDRVREVWDEWRRSHGETGWWPYVTLHSPEGLARSRRFEGADSTTVEELVRWSMECAFDDEDDREGWRDDYDPDRLARQLGPALAEPLPGVSRWGTGDRDGWVRSTVWSLWWD